MRSSTTLMASAIIVGLAAATPMQSHHGHVNCVAPQLWHICSDGWAGCCTTSPRNVDGGGKSYCTDTPTTITTTTPISTQIPAPALPEQPLDDIEWMEQCKEDNSNCNWNITYYSVKPQNETYARKQTQQFYVHKEEGAFEGRTNAIAVFSDIPDTVSKCTIRYVLYIRTIILVLTHSDGTSLRKASSMARTLAAAQTLPRSTLAVKPISKRLAVKLPTKLPKTL